jgi:hypothetical protein
MNNRPQKIKEYKTPKETMQNKLKFVASEHQKKWLVALQH